MFMDHVSYVLIKNNPLLLSMYHYNRHCAIALLCKNNIVEYIKYRINHLLHSSFVEYGESFHS